MVADIAAMQRVACWSISPLNALIATRLIEDGTLSADHRWAEGRAAAAPGAAARVPRRLRRADRRGVDARLAALADAVARQRLRRGRARTRRRGAAGRRVRDRPARGAARGAHQRGGGTLARRPSTRPRTARRRDAQRRASRLQPASRGASMGAALDVEVAIVGAGVIGLAIALRLLDDGREVMLIDPNEPGSGASFGNAGDDRRLRLRAGRHARMCCARCRACCSTAKARCRCRLPHCRRCCRGCCASCAPARRRRPPRVPRRSRRCSRAPARRGSGAGPRCSARTWCAAKAACTSIGRRLAERLRLRAARAAWRATGGAVAGRGGAARAGARGQLHATACSFPTRCTSIRRRC